MKRLTLVLSVFVLAASLFGCGSLRTYTLDEVLPAPVDEATLLSLIDSVTVVRTSDEREITVTGTDVELLMLSFDGIPCTRRESSEQAGDYVLTFTMTDKTDVRPPLYIVLGNGEYAPYFLYGGYEYESVNLWFDTAYMETLFH